MSASATKVWPEALNAREMALQRIFRMLTPQHQRAAAAAVRRIIDGQPLEQALIELGLDMGDTLEEAQERARSAIAADDIDWREMLD